MSDPSFVHLKVRTEFSLVDSIVRIKPLIKAASAFGFPAIAVGDFHNLMGLIKFYKAAQGSGIKPICATDFQLEEEGELAPSVITLFAMSDKGYRVLTELISLSYQKGQKHDIPYVSKEWVRSHSEDIICLSGAKFGDVGQLLLAGKPDEAQKRLDYWLDIFGDRYYIELQRTGRSQEESYLHLAVDLAVKNRVPVVATNDVRFLNTSEFEAHEVRVCIGEGRALDDPRRDKNYSREQYLKSPDEMKALFSDIPEAITNTVEIAKRCSFDIVLGKYFLPEYPIPDGLTEDQFFKKISLEGLEDRLTTILDKSAADYQSRKQEYLDRLDFELKIICDMGFPGYFLIVMDFIQWAKDHDIPVGPGRGSGAGSLVAYVLKITDLDPLEYDLLFERFLNPERVSMPDFDVDFCMENRDKVISYVADNYGRDAVSQIVTFGTMAAKAVVRDVARAQGKSYGLADKLSKMIPADIGMTLSKAIEQEEPLKEFIDTDTEAAEIWGMALQLEGITRNTGKHAGGVVIAPTKLTDFAPLYCDEDGAGLVTQYDKNDVEDAGLVKFDFLGLRTLTIIDWALKIVNAQQEKHGLEKIDIAFIPLDDNATFQLLKKAETTAVFQLESRGMKELIKRLQPDNLEDMIALVALFRPGPLQSGMVDDFINRKHGRAEVAYPDAKYQHERLKPILEPTYGVIVYQEQVMQIAQALAGYSLGGADMLRRAMGKKKPEEMAKQRSIFQEGAASEGIDPDLAIKIFDLVEKFAGYGFNKSHSAAYALVSYQTAWLKTHYPAAFMAATMSSDMDKTDKVVTFIEEVRNMGLTLLPPDVNGGEFQFTVDDDGNIIYGLGAIKGLGEGPVDAILEGRKDGPFTDLFDFCKRVDSRRVNKRSLEALVRSGAFDRLGPGVDIDYDRSLMITATPLAVKAAEQHTANQNAGMVDMFGEPEKTQSTSEVYAEVSGFERFALKERLDGERDTLGLYLTGHPIDEYDDQLGDLVSSRIVNIKPEKRSQTIAGLVVAFRLMKTKRGDNMAFITLDDRTARIEVAFFSKGYEEFRDVLYKDALLVVTGQVSHDDFSGGLKVRAERAVDIAQARLDKIRHIDILWPAELYNTSTVTMLESMLHPLRNEEGCAIGINYQKQGNAFGVDLAPIWRIKPTDELLNQLQRLFGAEAVQLSY